jgi:hypothetical protein
MFLGSRVRTQSQQTAQPVLGARRGDFVQQAIGGIAALNRDQRSHQVIDDAIITISAMNEALRRSLFPWINDSRIGTAHERLLNLKKSLTVAKVQFQASYPGSALEWTRDWSQTLEGKLSTLVNGLEATLTYRRIGYRSQALAAFRTVCEKAKELGKATATSHAIDLAVENVLVGFPLDENEDEGQSLES